MELTIKQSAINYMNNRMLWGHIFKVCADRLNKAKEEPVKELVAIPTLGLYWWNQEQLDMFNKWEAEKMELLKKLFLPAKYI